jgi:enterochelin esterase-like enzyme
MALLGTPLLVLLIFVAVIFPVATFLFWSRVRGPRAVRAGTRLALLFGGQLASVLLVAVVANDYGLFYASWSDLLGSQGTGASMSQYGGPGHGGRPTPTSSATSGSASIPRAPSATGARAGSRPLGRMQELGGTGWSSKSEWASRGAVEQVIIEGSTSGLSAHALVYLPPEYFQPSHAGERFPAVEVLTGDPGTVRGLMKRLNYPGVALRLVKAHQARPMIFVMLPSAVVAPRDTECTDVVRGPQVETYLSTELPSVVQAHLRIQTNDWGVVGNSTGGYCATKILMDHPDIFAGGVSLSGYYFARSDVTTGDLWGGSAAVRHANDPEWRLVHQPAPPVDLFITSSRKEIRFDGYPDALRFLREVKPPMRVTALIESYGGHNYDTWARELPSALQWLSSELYGAGRGPQGMGADASAAAGPPGASPAQR